MTKTEQTKQAEQMKWNAILEAEGLGVIGSVHLEFEIVADKEVTPGPASCPIPTENDYRILQRVREAGFVATPDEANATMGAIRRLADAGFANIRHHNGYRFLAIAGATDGDVANAAARYQAELDDAKIAQAEITSEKASHRILSRLKTLGDAADTHQLFAALSADFSFSEMEAGLAKLSGKARRVKTPHGFDILFLPDAGVKRAVEAAKRIQDTSKQASRHCKLSGKQFLSGASGDRPYNEPNPNAEEAAKDAAGDQFRAAYRKARKQHEELRKAGRLPKHRPQPDTSGQPTTGSVPEYLEAKISSRRRRKAIVRTMIRNARCGGSNLAPIAA